MSKRRPEGMCRICGDYGPLSFEHIPPKAAFNDRRIVTATFEEAITLGPDENIKGPVQQRGMGGYTLCGSCNSKTGSWYGPQFVSWCYRGMDILIRANGRPSLIYINELYPLPILKQMATMFFSVNADRFRTVHEELVNFVLDKETKYLSPRYRFFVYYNTTGRIRSFGGALVANTASGQRSMLSEITFPPFGYVLTLNSDPPDERLFEITHFARYGYRQQVSLPLYIPVLPTHLAIPGDYRSKQEIYKESSGEVFEGDSA